MNAEKSTSPTALTQQTEILRVKAGELGLQQDLLASEVPVEVFWNGALLDTLYATPQYLEEMAVGFLLAKGVISGRGELESVKIVPKGCERSNFVYQVQVRAEAALAHSKGLVQPLRQLAATGKQELEAYLAAFGLDIVGVNQVMAAFTGYSQIFAQTGAVHSCGLACGQKVLFWAEDVARFNAFNKTLGYYALNCAAFEGQKTQPYLLVSGRVAGEMLEQCAAVGIPLIVSKSAPLSRAVALAKQYKVGLIGFVRGDGFNVYHL